MEFRPKLFRWQPGRENSGYRILPLVHSSRLKLDVYLIFYPQGSEIKMHRDPAMFGQRHYRINLEVHKAKEGGEFQCETCIVNTGRLRIFRPDLYKHAVTKIVKGSRLIVSIGWLRKPLPVKPPTWGVNPDCPDCGNRLYTTNFMTRTMRCGECQKDYRCYHWPVPADYFKQQVEKINNDVNSSPLE